MVPERFTELCIKFLSHITDKIVLVESEWLKHSLPPSHFPNTHKLMSQQSLVQAKPKARPSYANNQHWVS